MTWWVFAVVTVVLVVLMTRTFVINAMTLKRDVDKRFDDFRDRLEREANATIDKILNADAGEKSP